ncbi:MAG: hypothetical protein ABIN01_02270 [Ferruginibacter sp.]
MTKRLLLIAFTFLFSLALHAQKLNVVVNYVTSNGDGNNNIFYMPDQLLNWDDFKGKPVQGSEAAALTNAGFGIKLLFKRMGNNSQLVIAVNCSFSRKDSWVKTENKTPYILNHEQKHFDIAYIHTCLFIQNLRKANFTNSNYSAVIQKVYNEAATMMTKTQYQYDGETSHSRLPEKQAEWDEKIDRQLKQ